MSSDKKIYAIFNMYIYDIRTPFIYATPMLFCIYARNILHHKRRIYDKCPNILYVHIKNCIFLHLNIKRRLNFEVDKHPLKLFNSINYILIFRLYFQL